MTNDYLRDLDDWDEESQQILLSLAKNNEFISFKEIEKGIFGKDPFEKIRINENSDRLVSPFYKEFGLEEGESIKVDVPISIFNYTGKKTSSNKKTTEEDPLNENPKEVHGYAYETHVQVEDTGTKVFEAYDKEKSGFNPYHVKLYYEKLNNQYFNFSGRNCIVNIGNTYYQNFMSQFPKQKIRSWYDNRTKSIIVDSIELEAKYTKLVLDSVHQDNQLSEVDIYKAIKLNAWSKSESGSILNAIGSINDGMAEAVAKIAEFIGKSKIEEKRYLADRDDYQPYLVEKAVSSPTVISMGIGISVIEKLVQKNLNLLKKLNVENYLPSGFKKAIEELTGFTTKVNTMIKSAVTIVAELAGEYLKLVNAFVCGLINGLISLFEFLFQIISFIIGLDASIKSYEDYLEQQKNIETLEEVLNFLFSEVSTFLDGFIDLIKDLKNTTYEDFEVLIKSLSEKLGNISRYQYAYYTGTIVFEVIVGVLLALLTGGSGNIAQAVSKSEKLIQFLKILGREFISTVTFGITDLLAIFRKLILSFSRACKNGFKGFIEWIRSLLNTESKHLEEVLDEVERISLKNYSKTEILALLVQDNINKFYNSTHLEAIYKKALLLDMGFEDLRGFVKTGNIKEIKSVELLKQMDNYINIVLKRGYPFGFRNLKEFEQFCDILKSELSSIGLSINDIRIQGSSLRKLKPKDLDLAVFIDDSNFNNLLRNAFEGKIKLNGKIVDISKMSDSQLMNLSENIFNNDKTNAVSRTFAFAMQNRKISGLTKPRIKAGHRKIIEQLNEKYKQLNIEDISIQTRGGKLELKPDLKIK